MTARRGKCNGGLADGSAAYVEVTLDSMDHGRGRVFALFDIYILILTAALGQGGGQGLNQGLEFLVVACRQVIQLVIQGSFQLAL